MKTRICLICRIIYLPTSQRQRFCGSVRKKEGCSYKNSLRYADKRNKKKSCEQKTIEWHKSWLKRIFKRTGKLWETWEEYKEYRRLNKLSKGESQRKYRESHPEKVNQIMKNWRNKNKEKWNLYMSSWREKHPGYQKMKDAKYRQDHLEERRIS